MFLCCDPINSTSRAKGFHHIGGLDMVWWASGAAGSIWTWGLPRVGHLGDTNSSMD